MHNPQYKVKWAKCFGLNKPPSTYMPDDDLLEPKHVASLTLYCGLFMTTWKKKCIYTECNNKAAFTVNSVCGVSSRSTTTRIFEWGLNLNNNLRGQVYSYGDLYTCTFNNNRCGPSPIKVGRPCISLLFLSFV